MKILVIENAGRIAACLSNLEVELACHIDETQALKAAEEFGPELVFLGYGLLADQTPDYIRSFANALPTASLIVVGENASDESVLRCLLAGAKGYQELQSLPHYNARLIQAIGRGEAWVSRKMVASLLDAVRQLLL